ncbi:MAG: DUF6036 family nucleotidyltransferase [Candidatus Micrarchaeia archaeon]
MARNAFDKASLEKEFERIGAALGEPATAFLLGGGAMAFRGQKNATKDLDLVFESEGEARVFAEALKKNGFQKQKIVEKEYAEMCAAGIWEEEKGFRVDLFVMSVCNALKLNSSITKRSELLGAYGKLTIKMFSNEDVVLFKSITERPDDANDIAAIVRQSGVDWDVILEEATRQSGERNWYGALYNKLLELNEIHGIQPQITGEVDKLYKRNVLREAFNRRLEQGLTREEALKELKKAGFSQKELAELG